ncbi:hypothetical protein [Actinacidiphila acididurans]|jgi:hypothetical protein|uniref:Uncharacterized protein n=1 Tax=Actinacidiphila acididurans TaxID=2784346 RepID=A0ABS2TYR2_9ACTN|nr:hypothetical protein [Actinacidiphila acididurans]MBM9508468.1 hypothetical protein [Actinacidiphila acididurans]
MVTQIVLWLVQQALETRYGPLMTLGLLALGMGIRSSRTPGTRPGETTYYCVGGVLVVLAWLAHR